MFRRLYRALCVQPQAKFCRKPQTGNCSAAPPVKTHFPQQFCHVRSCPAKLFSRLYMQYAQKPECGVLDFLGHYCNPCSHELFLHNTRRYAPRSTILFCCFYFVRLSMLLTSGEKLHCSLTSLQSRQIADIDGSNLPKFGIGMHINTLRPYNVKEECRCA